MMKYLRQRSWKRFPTGIKTIASVDRKTYQALIGLANLDIAERFTSERSRSGHREKTWLLRNTKRLCRLAGVPVRTTHGLRGTWSTLTTEAGVSGHIIMREMGHESLRTTRDHYIAPGAEERARTRKFLTVLAGGAATSAPEKEEGEKHARGNPEEPEKFPREMDRKKAL